LTAIYCLCSMHKNMESILSKYLNLHPNIYYDNVSDSCGKKQGYNLRWRGWPRDTEVGSFHDLGSITIMRVLWFHKIKVGWLKRRCASGVHSNAPIKKEEFYKKVIWPTTKEHVHRCDVAEIRIELVKCQYIESSRGV